MTTQASEQQIREAFVDEAEGTGMNWYDAQEWAETQLDEGTAIRIEIDHPTGKANFSTVTIGSLSIAFSYSTPIGYTTDDGFNWTVRENDWGPTTGKHLNKIDGGNLAKHSRLPSAEFEAALAREVAP